MPDERPPETASCRYGVADAAMASAGRNLLVLIAISILVVVVRARIANGSAGCKGSADRFGTE